MSSCPGGCQCDKVPKANPVIVIHGGAWAIPEKLEVASREGVKNAAKAGWKVLSEGGSAVDAVMEAVKDLLRYPLAREGVYTPVGPAFLAHTKQKVSNIVGLRPYG